MNHRGFSFTELLVAMVLMGIISTAIYSLLNNNQRVYREQTARIEMNQNVRAAVSILPMELRELDASDPNGSDIVAMNASSIAYNAMRNLHFLCQAPNTAALQVTLAATPWFGLQALDETAHLFLLFAENDPATRTDDAWLHVNSTVRTNGTACPGGAASITLTLTGTTTAALTGVTNGAPIRGYVVTRVQSYQDANGDYWLGMQVQNKTTTAWGTMQPIVGPVTASGFNLAYYDSDGAVTAVPANVARVAITVEGLTNDPVRGPGGTLQHITSSLLTQVALRNNRRF
jgi:prepilin-type N-terminal cleavage/methylation domain-containing protein